MPFPAPPIPLRSVVTCVLIGWLWFATEGTAQHLTAETGLLQYHADSTQAAPASTFHPYRFWVGTGATVAADLAVMVGLNQLWYSGYERSRFHWHNDWNNWLQQDKIGHMITAWHIARVFGAYGTWAGLSRKQAGLYGGVVSTLFQSQIEVLDGFSEAWGASWGDLIFNTVGGAIGGLQVAYPELHAFTIKYGYHRSPFYDQDLSYIGNALKDYDGISYWMVVRPEMLLSDQWKTRWPDWLALSIGISADGLAEALSTPAHPHQRVFLVGLDLDFLRSIQWPHRWMQIAAEFFSFIRIPAPALVLSPRVKWHWAY